MGFHSAPQDLIPRFETSQVFCGSQAFLPAAKGGFAAGGPSAEARSDRQVPQTQRHGAEKLEQPSIQPGTVVVVESLPAKLKAIPGSFGYIISRYRYGL